MTNTKTRQPTLARAAMKFLCTLLGLVLALMLAVTWGVLALFNRISPIDPMEMLQLTGQRLGSYLSQEAERLSFGQEPGTSASGEGPQTLGGKNSNIVNILLIGQDRREGQGRARSDAMILCSFNKSTKTLVLTSILRDLYVDIPGYQANRINAAYASGGMSLLDETLSQCLGIHIDGNVEVDFDQFAAIIDQLGGVTLELRQDEAELINREVGGTLTEGPCRLTGIQALTYARIRKLDADGDFSRTSRQRKVLNALLDTYQNTGFPTLLGLVDDILPMVTTDISGAHLAAYALELFPMLGELEIVTHRIPADGTYANQSIRGMSVLVADMEENRELLRDILLEGK